MPELKEIRKFPTLVNDFLMTKKRKRSAIGSKIIGQRLRKIGELAPNGQPIEISRVILIKKGETVPQALRSIAGLKLDARGILNASYSDGWCQSHWNQSSNWGDTWGECWDNSTSLGRIKQNILVLNTISNKVKAFSLKEFNSEELKAISKLGIIG